jgi:tetratricopeptide (TPR) repeat protein
VPLWLPIAAIVVAALWAYAPSFDGAFVFDDGVSIVNNPHVRAVWPLTSAMTAPAEAPTSGRPITALTFAMNGALAPDPPSAWGFHVVNFGIHVAAALLLFGVVRRTLTTPRLAGSLGDLATPIAGVVALLWVEHPLTTEAVTYLTQRLESLMSVFYLATLYCAIRAREENRRSMWTALAIVCCALGMGSKETMVSAPLVVALWDWLFDRPRWSLYFALAATWIVLAVTLSIETRPHSVGFALGFTPWSYLVTEAGVIAHYLRLVFWPAPLVLDYGWGKTPLSSVLPQALLVTALFAVTVFGLIRRSPAAFLGAIFFCVLAPSSSVLPVATEVAAEHRMYLPLAAVIAAVAIGAVTLARQRLARATWRSAGAAGLCLTLALVVALGVTTRARNVEYQTEESLWRANIAARPDNARGHVSLGVALYDQDRLTEAAAELREAIRLDDSLADAHLNLGSVLCRQQQFEACVAEFQRTLALDPETVEAERNLGEAYGAMGRIPDALVHFERALKTQPDDVKAMSRVAWILATSTDARLRNGARAKTLASQAVTLTHATDPQSLDALAAADAELGDFPAAIATVTQALALPASGPPPDALQAHLDAYRRRQPVRE